MVYDKNDLQEIQADVLTSDLTENPYISKLKQLKTDNKVLTKAVNAVFEQLGNAQTSAADAVQRVVAAEESLDSVGQSLSSVEQTLDNVKQSLDSMTTRVDTLETNCGCDGGVTRGNTVSEPTAVGVVTWQHVLLADHLVLDGQTVTASAYPELLRFVTTHQLTVSAEEYAANCALYVYNLTADTLTLPNLMNRTVWGASAPACIEAGLPNITGSASSGTSNWPVLPGCSADNLSGAFSSTNTGGKLPYGTSYSEPNETLRVMQLDLDASRANTVYGASETVQPPAIGLIPQVRVKPLAVTSTNVQVDDGTPVGRVVFDSFLRDGYIKANGAAVADASVAIPRLVTLVHDHPELLGDDAVHYAYDETTDTLTLPNYIGLVPQGGESVSQVAAGLPNVKSTKPTDTRFFVQTKDYSKNVTIGAMQYLHGQKENIAAIASGNMFVWTGRNVDWGTFDIDASRCSSVYRNDVTTVQPPAVTLIPQIRY